jgi:hypothetical protein
MEIAASCACATAQMMFFGSERRVAAEEHPGARRLHGRVSTTGMPSWSNSRPASRSIHGNAFS